MSSTRILLIGANGFVGGNLMHRHRTRPFPGIELVPAGASSEPEGGISLDIRDETAIRKALTETGPDCVVNLACLSAAACEKDPDRARAVQVDGTANCGRACHGAGIRFIQLSTDMVWSGTKKGRLTVDDPPDPRNVYGTTKWEGEQALARIGGNCAVIRSGLVLGITRTTRPGFVDWMLARIKNDEPIPLFTDQYRIPVTVDDLTDIIVRACESACTGLLLAAGDERVNRVRLGEMLLDGLGKDHRLIKPVRMADVDTGVSLIADLSMDNTRAKETLGKQPFDELAPWFARLCRQP